MRQWLNELLLLRCGFIESTDIWEIFSRNRTWKWRWGKLNKKTVLFVPFRNEQPRRSTNSTERILKFEGMVIFYSTSLPLIQNSTQPRANSLTLCVGIYQDKSHNGSFPRQDVGRSGLDLDRNSTWLSLLTCPSWSRFHGPTDRRKRMVQLF